MNNGLSKVLVAGMMIAGLVGTSSAAVTQTFGSGSAVTSVTNSADFELNTNLITPYTEGGMVFTYNGSNNNNGCGFAGCGYHSGFYPGFSGNYMYSVGDASFIGIKMSNGMDFLAIEFAAGSGFGDASSVHWETYNDTVLTGSGDYAFDGVQVLGLSDASGFDEVRYYNPQSGSDNPFVYGAPAIDTVRAGTRTTNNNVPEPASLALVAAALIGLGSIRRNKR